MDNINPDIKTDILKGQDRGESTRLMEPLLPAEGSPHRADLNDLALDLAAHSTGLRRSLPAGILTALAKMVRSMNCYYSNLIEGHDTHPIEIERALKKDFSKDPKKRNLQLEAKAHIATQEWIDNGNLRDREYSEEAICEIHRRFTELLPKELRRVEDPMTKEKISVIPGQLRNRDVKVGHHIPISAGAIPRFLKRFKEVYEGLGKTESILAAGAAHHRLLWIHPFLDGNGRVARLMSYAVLLNRLETGGVWSIARGLARNEARYKELLMACDSPRRNDLDGRGTLSEEALVNFIRFFLEICLDQVRFMEDLMQPNRLRNRILIWAREEIEANLLPQKAGKVLEAVLYRGELPRGEVNGLIETGERQARRVVSSLIEREIITSKSPRAPLQLAFPAKLAPRWMPGLFPEK